MSTATPIATSPPASAAANAPGLTVPASRLAQFSWALFDGARSPYNVLVNIFVFSAYFSTVVIPDPVRGQTLWSFVTSTAAIVIALTAPVLGAIADAGGRRKPWLVATIVIGVPSMLTLWFATPGMPGGLGMIMLALIGGSMFYEYSAIFCNAMLPNVVRPERIGFLSGAGLALANVSGVILFVFFLFAWSWNPHPWFGLDLAQHEPERAVGILSAIWIVVFGLPLFLFTPDSPSTSRSIPEAVTHGFRSIIETVTKIGRYRNAATFLVARVFFFEGFIVLMLFTGVFAAGILKWTATMLIIEGLINSVVAALAAMFAGWLDTRIGSKPSTIVFVVGCLAGNAILCSVTQNMVFFIPIDSAATATGGLFPTLPDKVFLVTQCSIAFFVTGGMVTGRALMAKLAPPSMLNEFFGLFAMSGTATSFVGPACIGILTAVFQNQRAGVAVGLFFLAVGLFVMFKVREEPTVLA
ncbi:MAG: MFS transporter [Gammaproteobacteria bacterium]